MKFISKMTRNDVLNVLGTHKTTFAQRFGVTEIALYGSFAHDQATNDSDVDVLVRFDEPPDWKRYFGTQGFLDDVLGRPVDLATSQDLRVEIRPYVEREVISV